MKVDIVLGDEFNYPAHLHGRAGFFFLDFLRHTI